MPDRATMDPDRERLRRAAEACRNMQALAPADKRPWFDWVPQYLDRLAGDAESGSHAHEVDGYGCCRKCGERVECGRCRSPYDEQRDSLGVCAECLAEDFGTGSDDA